MKEYWITLLCVVIGVIIGRCIFDLGEYIVKKIKRKKKHEKEKN